MNTGWFTGEHWGSETPESEPCVSGSTNNEGDKKSLSWPNDSEIIVVSVLSGINMTHFYNHSSVRSCKRLDSQSEVIVKNKVL